MLSKNNPALIFVADRYINVENIYSMAQHGLSLQLDYFSGEKELLQFATRQELEKAKHKFDAAQMALDFGTNYAAR
jgi:hypothetical protein